MKHPITIVMKLVSTSKSVKPTDPRLGWGGWRGFYLNRFESHRNTEVPTVASQQIVLTLSRKFIETESFIPQYFLNQVLL